MNIFDEAEILFGQAGLPGTGLTSGEKTAILTDLADLKARPIPPDTTTDLTDWSTAAPAEGQFAIYTGGKWTPVTRPTITVPFAMTIMAGNGTTAISAGTVGYIVPNFACTITGWAIVNTPSGSIQWDIRKTGVSIVGSTPPKVTSSTQAQSTVLTGWTTAIAAGEALAFSVTTATTSTLASLNLHLTRSI